jgi:hypothetical protein
MVRFDLVRRGLLAAPVGDIGEHRGASSVSSALIVSQYGTFVSTANGMPE